MRVDMQCFLCCAKKAAGLLEQYRVPDEKAALLMREIFGELSRTEEETSAPVLMAEMMEVLEERVGISDAYEKPKRLYNGLLMEKAEEVYREIQSSPDPFLLGLRYALTETIDFGAMDAVCQETLEELLGKCRQVSVNQRETERLRKSSQRRIGWSILPIMPGRLCWTAYGCRRFNASIQGWRSPFWSEDAPS
ncbi:MAG: ARMT1-like domain-containing protein [Blautia sp.]